MQAVFGSFLQPLRSGFPRAAATVLLGVALGATQAPGQAFAQPQEAGDAESRAAASFEAARRELDAGNFETACRLFDESQALSPSPGTLLNVGNCRERKRDLVGALAAFEAALRLARGESDAGRREAFSKAARGRMDLLTPRFASLVLRPSPTPQVAVRLDGELIALRGQSIRLNPGRHRVRATAPGHDPYVQSFALDEGQALELPIPVLLASTPAGETVEGATDSSGATASSESHFGLAPPLLAGGGALLVAAGVVTGQVAASRERELDEGCGPAPAAGEPRPCPGLADTHSSAKSLALAADVLWISGAVLAGVGVTLFVLDAAATEEHGGSSLTARCSLRGCALSGTF